MIHIYKKLNDHFVLSDYPHVWPFKVYVRNVDDDPSKGYREFTGPGGHHVGEYGYPLFYRDLEAEIAVLLAALKAASVALPLTAEVRDGLIWVDGVAWGAISGDRVANANDLMFAERFVTAYAGQTLYLHPVTLKIITP